MSDDTISRDAAIDAIFKTCRRTCTLSHELEKAFERLPSAQPHDIARDIATIIENEKDMRVMLKNAQPDVPDTNVGDIISRRQAITQLSHNKNKGDDEWELAVENDIRTIWKLPPAQPEKRTEERTETHACDSISRRAAINDIRTMIPKDAQLDIKWIEMWLMQLPSAEPQIIRCENCKHYKEWESEFTPNAVVTQCMADNFPIRKAIPDGWFCAGAERRTDE